MQQDFNEVGRQSLMLLLEEIDRGHALDRRVVVPPELKIRESTAPPRP